MKLSGSLIAIFFVWLLFPSHITVDAVSKQTKDSKDSVRDIRFKSGQTSALLKGTLSRYSKHIYRFHARSGQTVMIELLSQKEGTKPEDLVFWVQSRGWFPPGKNTALLDGIDKGGVTTWSGKLPGTGEYEIYLSNPPITDHAIQHTLTYKLRITIE